MIKQSCISCRTKHCIIGRHFVQRARLLALLPCAACRRSAGRRPQASNSECFSCQAPAAYLQLMLHSISLVNSWSRDGNHEFMTCKWNEHFSKIVNFVILTSSLFMFTLDNIRYEGDTDFVFVVLLLYDNILSNTIKILKKIDLWLDTHLDYHQPQPSLIMKWRTQ